MMRHIDEIILHCSATPEGRDVSLDDIRRWHVDERGWSDVGYHFVITLDGMVHVGRPMDIAGAHVKGRNANTIGICYIGGMDEDMVPKDTLLPKQEDPMRKVIAALRLLFGDLALSGHHGYSSKACPSFNVKEKFADLI